MFGYVLINKPEIKFKEYDVYHSYYCGLCKSIKHRHGFFARFSVNYDLTFLALLLSGLYEPGAECSCERCIVHPFHKNKCCRNIYLDYSADMNVYLAYLKCIDDWKDERKWAALLYAKLLKRKALGIEREYPDKTKHIRDKMEELSRSEQAGSDNLDEVSGIFGAIMREIFVVKEDVFSEALSDMGYYLGKFIYILDAYEDLEKDKKDNCYNPLFAYEDRDDFKKFVQKILVSMMGECCKSFEYLPILENIEILRNILYSGVWTKYSQISNRKL